MSVDPLEPLPIASREVLMPVLPSVTNRSSLGSKPFVQRRGHAQIELSGKMFAWLNPLLCAHFKESLQGNFPLFAEIVHTGSVEICSAIEPDKFTPEHVDLRII